MTVGFFILTYERPKILAACLSSAFNNTSIKPNVVEIIDDGSSIDIRRKLLEFQHQYSTNESVINLNLSGTNKGVGFGFEKLHKAIQVADPDLAIVIESDHLYRRQWLEDCLAVFEASPESISIAGYHHPDMHIREKTHGEFPKLMIGQFGEDLKSRDYLYQPFDLNTSRGKIQVQGVSNSCGSMILHWGRIKQYLFKELGVEVDFWNWMARAYHKVGWEQYGSIEKARKFASDSHLSSTLSYYGEKWIEKQGLDVTSKFPMLSISDYSIANHYAGGETSINGKIVPEGCSFQGVYSPAWDDKYLNMDPRGHNE